MRIFVTGASGFVGSAVSRELVSAGFEVVGVARTDAAATTVAASGARVHRADLEHPESLRSGAAEADAVIHAGFVHDFSRFKACCELDREVIAVLGSALAGPQCPLIVTSAIGVLGGGAVTEETLPPSPSPNPRVATEEAARTLLDRGVNVSIVRLPPTTHGRGDHGFLPMLIDIARQKGAAAYVEDGQNRWPAVHREDAAQVYRLAVERNVAGAYYHAVAEEGVPFRSFTEVIGRRLQLPVVSKTREEAAAHFGWLAHFASSNFMASSARTREQLGWTPTRPGLLADLDQPHYF